jgi:hypothetical protein
VLDVLAAGLPLAGFAADARWRVTGPRGIRGTVPG